MRLRETAKVAPPGGPPEELLRFCPLDWAEPLNGESVEDFGMRAFRIRSNARARYEATYGPLPNRDPAPGGQWWGVATDLAGWHASHAEDAR